MSKKNILIGSISLLLITTACGGTVSSTKLTTLKRTDKSLTCQEILVEITEAEFYGQMAMDNKKPKLSTVLSPVGYLGTYSSAQTAIDSSKSRMAYLDKLYQVNQCDEKRQQTEQLNKERKKIAKIKPEYQSHIANNAPKAVAPNTRYFYPSSGHQQAPVAYAYPQPQQPMYPPVYSGYYPR